MTIGIEEDFFIDGLKIKTVQAFKYPGLVLEQHGSSTMEIEKRIGRKGHEENNRNFKLDIME